MSMSLHAVAVLPADDNYKIKLAAYRACEAAGVRPPRELVEFFGDDGPDDDGTLIRISDMDAGDGKFYRTSPPHGCVSAWSDEMRSGFQVDIKLLPPGTRYIRFYGAW